MLPSSYGYHIQLIDWWCCRTKFWKDIWTNVSQNRKDEISIDCYFSLVKVLSHAYQLSCISRLLQRNWSRNPESCGIGRRPTTSCSCEDIWVELDVAHAEFVVLALPRVKQVAKDLGDKWSTKWFDLGNFSLGIIELRLESTYMRSIF